MVGWQTCFCARSTLVRYPTVCLVTSPWSRSAILRSTSRLPNLMQHLGPFYPENMESLDCDVFSRCRRRSQNRPLPHIVTRSAFETWRSPRTRSVRVSSPRLWGYCGGRLTARDNYCTALYSRRFPIGAKLATVLYCTSAAREQSGYSYARTDSSRSSSSSYLCAGDVACFEADYLMVHLSKSELRSGRDAIENDYIT